MPPASTATEAPHPPAPGEVRRSAARLPQQPARPGFLSTSLKRYLPSVLIFVAVFAAWQLVVSVLGVREYILPSPSSVWRALVSSDVPWGKHMLITTVEIVGGFVL